jgi:hypothetical protein
MSLIDLRLEYKRQTGKPNIPINHDHYDDPEYIIWLEEELIKLKQKEDELRRRH